MKITKSQLQRIIKEELEQVMMEGAPPDPSSPERYDPRASSPRRVGDPARTVGGQPVDIYGNIKQAGVDYTDPRRPGAPTEAGRQGMIPRRDRPTTYQGATTMALVRGDMLPGDERRAASRYAEYPGGIPTYPAGGIPSDSPAAPGNRPRYKIEPVDESLINDLTEAVLAKLMKK
jgi:hypothetical protein